MRDLRLVQIVCLLQVYKSVFLHAGRIKNDRKESLRFFNVVAQSTRSNPEPQRIDPSPIRQRLDSFLSIA
jgi:hypothetical protein